MARRCRRLRARAHRRCRTRCRDPKAASRACARCSTLRFRAATLRQSRPASPRPTRASLRAAARSRTSAGPSGEAQLRVVHRWGERLVFSHRNSARCNARTMRNAPGGICAPPSRCPKGVMLGSAWLSDSRIQSADPGSRWMLERHRARARFRAARRLIPRRIRIGEQRRRLQANERVQRRCASTRRRESLRDRKRGEQTIAAGSARQFGPAICAASCARRAHPTARTARARRPGRVEHTAAQQLGLQPPRA